GPAPLSISDGEGRGVRSPGAEVRRPDHTIEEGLTVEQVVFESEPDLPIPGLVCIPPGPGPHPALLFLDDRGKDVEAGAAGLVPALARAGNLVLAVDLRGWGETAWRRRFPNDPDDVGWLGNDSMLAYAGYLLGGWPVAQRVRDAVRALDVLGDRSDVDPSRLGIVGRGTGGLIALHTAALDRRVTGVAACEALASYRSIVEADRYRCPVSAFIPGVLLRYDLPDLIGALAPLPTVVVNPVDATGAPLVADAAEPVYLRARRTYELLEAGDRLRLRAAASKDQVFEELISWAAF
ncbi:MAG TPA: acetylxylan esterase, partial [Chloroflexota bacterium]|nr:acetylxylan esterase [Chloroflexota bacterium]